MDELKEKNREEQFLFASEDQFGIYQLKKDESLRDYRFEGTDRLKNAGLKVDKLNYELKYVDRLEENTTLDDLYMKFNIDKPKDFTGHSLSVGDIILIHQNGENIAQFVDSFGFTEIMDFLEKENLLENFVSQKSEYLMESDTECAYKIADRYISIHEVDEGFDYTIYDENYKELDGGVYDNPDIPIEKAINDIVEDLKEPHFNTQTEQYYRTEVQGNIRMSDILVPMDYDELEEKVELAMKQEVVDMPKVEVTLIVAECNEFHAMGELHEGIADMDEAIKIFDSIPPERMHGIPSISINLHTEGTETYEDCEFGVLVGRTIDLDNLNYFNEIRNNSEAMDKIAEIIAKKPEAEIYGVVPPQIKSKIQEYRYEGMSEVEQLADKIDSFIKEYDSNEYADQVSDREIHLQQLVSDIEQGEVEYLQYYFQNIKEESNDQVDIQTVKEISDKLTEYKPLAKVEELEEQNYNMIDNVLNNGCEKFNKEEEKKGRSVSLKAKLEEKKKIVAGNDFQKEQGKETIKIVNRDI